MRFANLLSYFRILVLPLLIYLLFFVDAGQWPLVLLGLAFVSDIIDEYMGSRRRRRSEAGSVLDPFADKILILGLLFAFVIDGSFSPLLLAFFLFRDVIVGIVRWLAHHENIIIRRARIYSKILNYSHFGLLFVLVAQHYFAKGKMFDYLPFAERLYFILIIVSVVVALASIIAFFVHYTRNLGRRLRRGKKVEQEKMIVLANRKSRGFYDLYRKRLLKIFVKRRRAKLFRLPRKGDMFRGMHTETKKFDHVVIAGGDGSFEAALNYKPFEKKSLGFFPLGAGNAFYSYFYKGKRFEYLRDRFHFHEETLDVLELEWEGKKIQTTFLAVGIDAEVIRLSTKRSRHGFLDYLKGSVVALVKSRCSFDLRVKVDGEKKHFGNCMNLTLGKVPFYGFSLRSLVGNVHPDDRKVYGLAVVNTHSKIWNKTIRLWALLVANFGFEREPFVKLKGRRIVVESDEEFPVQAGGDYLGMAKKIKVRVIRRQKVLVI